jgi:hypothetical protein
MASAIFGVIKSNWSCQGLPDFLMFNQWLWLSFPRVLHADWELIAGYSNLVDQGTQTVAKFLRRIYP